MMAMIPTIRQINPTWGHDKVLQEAYPEREAKGMLSTIHIQVPNRLRNDNKLNFQKSDKGFWIEGGSDNVEPEAKPAKAKKEKASK